MNTNISNISLDRFDDWLKADSSAAALVMRQWLRPVEGRDAVIFPPTYAEPDVSEADKKQWRQETLGYNIDRLPDGTTICQIDSVGSQANRMEPIFKRDPYKALVPQVVVDVRGFKVNLLDAGHRAADAVVRFSDLRRELEGAFCAFRDKGNAEPLAKIAPTSIVFGSWDSRSTEVKISRVVRSVIRAYQVDLLHRSAQYTPPVRYVNIGAIEVSEEVDNKTLSQLGLRDNPASWTHGGIRLRPDGEIRRDAALNITAVRALGADSDDSTLKLRRYILGLALVAFTAPQDMALREGCQLVPDIEKASHWELVHHDGKRETFSVSHTDALAYATAAAGAFGVGHNREVPFDRNYAEEQLSKSKEQRKAEKRRGRVIAGEGENG